jgi:hypothetical protein
MVRKLQKRGQAERITPRLFLVLMGLRFNRYSILVDNFACG